MHFWKGCLLLVNPGYWVKKEIIIEGLSGAKSNYKLGSIESVTLVTGQRGSGYAQISLSSEWDLRVWKYSLSGTNCENQFNFNELTFYEIQILILEISRTFAGILGLMQY